MSPVRPKCPTANTSASRRLSAQRGFTYVELGVVLVVLVLMAMAIVPNMVRMDRQREVRRFKAELAALARDTKSRALESGDTVTLSFDKTELAFQQILEHDTETTRTLQTLKLPDGIKTTRFSADKYESPADGWRLPFFFDGTSSGGGVEMEIEGKPWSLVVTAGDGHVRTIDDSMPDMAEDKWKAGGYDKR